MAFKMKSYKQLLSMTKEKFDDAMVPLRVRSAKAKAEIVAAKLEEEMLELETEINTMCAEKDIDFAKIIEKIDSYDLKERKLGQVNGLVKELFPKNGR